MSPAELPTAEVRDLPKDGLVLLDVREDDEWAAGHAPGAVHIPMGELPARVGELTDLPDQPIHVICRSGGRSARAAAWLNQSGWDAVNVAGGMGAWQREGRPMVSEHPGIDPEVI